MWNISPTSQHFKNIMFTLPKPLSYSEHQVDVLKTFYSENEKKYGIKNDHFEFVIADKKWLTDGDIFVLCMSSKIVSRNENTFVNPLV